MQIGVIGINHKSADLQFREFFAKICQRRFDPFQSLHPTFSYVLLSTCNRTEIYFHSDGLTELHSHLFSLLRKDIPEEFEHKIYSYFGTECFIHLAMVTSGLDSALIAETEIQGQVKKAYENFALCKDLPYELHFLFQKCLKIGKQIRQTFSQKIDFCYLPSMTQVILKKSQKILGDLQDKRFLFVGASEINQKIILELKNTSIFNITLCNRSQETANAWSKEYHLNVLSWPELKRWPEFDIILFGTKSTDYLVKYSDVGLDIVHPKVLIDLSVPRNVDPELSKRFSLINVDQLSEPINQQERRKALQIAHNEKRFVAQEAKKQVQIYLNKEKAKKEWLALSSPVQLTS